MYDQNISKGAERQNSNRTGGNSNTPGAALNHHASRVYDSPSSHSDQEYVYHGAPRAPSQLLGPGVSMAANNASFVQPGHANVFANQSPFMMEPMDTNMQSGYQVPGANFQAPLHRLSGAVMEKVQVQASPVVQELYSMPSTPDLQYELWANLEPEIFAQEPVPQYNVAPGDIGTVESFGYEQPRPSMPFSTTWNSTPAICQQYPGPNTNIAADYKTWAILSQALPDVGVDDASNSGQASIASTSTGDATTRKDRQEYSAWQAQHGVAQNSNQGYTSRQAQREVTENSNQRYPSRQVHNEVAQNSNQGYASRQAQHEVAQNSNQGYASRQAQHEVAQNSNHGYLSRQAQHEVVQNSNQGYPSRQAQPEVAQNSSHGYPSRRAQHEVVQNSNQGYASRQAQPEVAQNSSHGYPSRQAQHEVVQNSNQGYPSRQAQPEVAQNSSHGYPSRQAQHEVVQNSNQGYPSRQAQPEVAQNSSHGYPSRQAQHEVVQNSNQGYPSRQAQHEVAQNSSHGYPSRRAQHEVVQNSNQGYASRQAQHEVAQNSNHGYLSRQAQHEVVQNSNQGYPSRQAQPEVAQNSSHGYPSRQAQHEVVQNSNQGYPSRQAQPEVAQNSSHGYPSRQAQHEVAQHCNQGYPSRQAQHEVAQNSNQGLYPLAVNEYGGTNMMDMVMEDSISDGISSTEDPSQREVAPAQIPHGYNTQNFSSDSSAVTDSGWQRSSRPENNVWDPQPLPELQESYNASTAGAAAFNGGAVANDFTQLMGQGLSGIRQLGEARWAIQLLSLCAEAIASQNVTRTQHLMWVLNDLASLGGDVNQRFAAYGLRALYMRVTNHTEAIKTYMRPRHHDQEITCGPKTVHNALVKFHEYVPWHQNCYSASSQTLLEVCAGKSRLHLIDIGAGKGIEWPIFIDALVSRAGGPPSILRITMIKERRKEEQAQAKSVSSEAADFMTRLVKFASGLGLHVEVNVVGKALECVTREDLRLRQGEILAVVCQFRLHRLMEEVPEPPSNSPPPSKPLLSPRDEFLDFLFQLNPHVLIMSDNDSDQCPAEFLPRFQSVASFWWSFFESMDIGYAGRDSQGRQIIEYEAGLMVLNVAACEGKARIERNEPYERWSRRIRRAGFVPKVLSDEAKKVCQDLVVNHGSFWDLAFDDNNCVLLRWRKEPMTFTSVWATPDHCSKHSCKCSMLHN